MFGLFKKKTPRTPTEEHEAMMNAIFDGLKTASRKSGIEQMFLICNTFGTFIPALREHFPGVPIEEDGPAMTVLQAGSQNPNWQAIDSDVDYMMQQVRDCPRDPMKRMIIVQGFLAPEYLRERFREAETQLQQPASGPSL